MVASLVNVKEFFRICHYAGLRVHLQTEDQRHWQTLFRNLPSVATTVISYWELGFDLCGQPDARRRGLLQRIIQDLRRPRGSIAFWPYATLDAGALVPSQEFFWRGVHAVQASVVLSFGDTLFRALFPHLDVNCDVHQAGTVQVHRLPSLECIASDDEETYNRTIAMMTALLQTDGPSN